MRRPHIPRPRIRLRLVELLVAIAGVAVMSICLAAVDLRLGGFFAGAALLLSTIDTRPRRFRT